MKIRHAASSDLPRIVAIHNQAIQSGATGHTQVFTPDSRREWFLRHSISRPILVAEADGQVVGWANLTDYRSGRQALRYTAELSYYVDFDQRRAGTGTTLVQRLLELCPGIDVRTVLAILLANNVGSVGLLESLGFSLWGTLPGVAVLEGEGVDHFYYGLSVAR